MLPCRQQVCGQHHAKGETFLQWWSGLLFGESSASWRIGPTWISLSSMQTNTNSGPGTEQHQESMQVSNWLRSSSAEKEEDAVRTARCRRASRTLGYHKGNSTLSCSSKRTATNSWQLIVLFYLVLLGPHVKYCVQSGASWEIWRRDKRRNIWDTRGAGVFHCLKISYLVSKME